MRSIRFITILGLLFVSLVIVLTPTTQAQTEVAIAPNVFLRGMQFSDEVRYTATFIKPADDAVMKRISVEITLPANVFFKEMFVSQQVGFDVIRIDKEQELTLIWQIGSLPPDVALDAFAFTLQEPLTRPIEFYIEWQNENDEQFFENFFDFPAIIPVTQTEGSLFPLVDTYSPVGETGVQLASESQANLLSVKVLPIDFNPPADLGDIWWCSLLEVLGLEEGKPAQVIVPLRRPVAPFTELQLFHQQADGTWKALEGQTGIVTADGQFVMYTHPGGIVASGGASRIQMQDFAISEVPVEVFPDASQPPPVEEFPPAPADLRGLPQPANVSPPADAPPANNEAPVENTTTNDTGAPAAGDAGAPPPAGDASAPPPAGDAGAPPADNPPPQNNVTIIPIPLDPAARCEASNFSFPIPNAQFTVPAFGKGESPVVERVNMPATSECSAVQCQVDGIICAVIERTLGAGLR